MVIEAKTRYLGLFNGMTQELLRGTEFRIGNGTVLTVKDASAVSVKNKSSEITDIYVRDRINEAKIERKQLFRRTTISNKPKK
jgi:hypothetical protein